MDYQRPPLIPNQNHFGRPQPFKKSVIFNPPDQLFLYEKQNLKAKSSQLNKKIASKYQYQIPSFNPNVIHVTSQMINDIQIQKDDKQKRTSIIFKFKQSIPEQTKKYSVKHFQIQSKLNKIQSYHHKISTLLQTINFKDKTPSKKQDLSFSFTPNKTKVSSTFTPSYLISKKSPSLSKEKTQTQRQKYSYKFSPNQRNLPQSDQQEDFQYQRQPEKTKNRIKNGSIRENNHFINQRGGPFRNQCRMEEVNRKKSKQFMKSIEGEVKDIQTTIQILNKKIKQVGNITFKKQVDFGDLSSSNPQSLVDTEVKSNHSNQPSYTKFNKSIIPMKKMENINPSHIIYSNRTLNAFSPLKKQSHCCIEINKIDQRNKQQNNYIQNHSFGPQCNPSNENSASNNQQTNRPRITQQYRKNYNYENKSLDWPPKSTNFKTNAPNCMMKYQHFE